MRSQVVSFDSFWHELTYNNTSTIYRLNKRNIVPGVGIDYVVMRKGKVLKSHYHKRPCILILVVKGKGVVTLNGEEKSVKEGDVISILPGTSHGFRALSAKFIFVSIQRPAIYGRMAKKDTYFGK